MQDSVRMKDHLNLQLELSCNALLTNIFSGVSIILMVTF